LYQHASLVLRLSSNFSPLCNVCVYQVIIGGAMEEISLQTLLQGITAEVQKLASVKDGSVNQRNFEEQMYQKFKGEADERQYM
jgi:hypothetical protein